MSAMSSLSLSLSESTEASEAITSTPSLSPTITLDAPEHIVSLATSSLLVSVEVNVWTATKQDRKISDEITSSKSAVHDAGKFTKNLLASAPEHKALLNYRQTVYNWLQRIAYDWAGPIRCLPSFQIEQFEREYSQHEKAFGELLDKFCDAYPSIVSDAAFKQGSMFDRNEYPPVDVVRSRFRITRFVTTLPANDFRSSVSEALAEDLKNHYERQVKEKIDIIMADAADRLLQCAERLSNACATRTLEEIDEAGGKIRRKKIYDSTVDQAKEICETLKKFNLTNNSELETARSKLERALNGVTTTDLRESSFVRSTVKEEVDDILSTFKPLSSSFNLSDYQ